MYAIRHSALRGLRNWSSANLRVSVSAAAAHGRLGFRAYSKTVPFTAETYGVERNESFKKLDSNDLAKFQEILADKNLIVDSASELASHNEDYMHKYMGQSKLLLKPKTTQQVSEILKYCNEQKLAVVPQGGNTGLVGGSVPVFEEIIISLASMDKVRSFDKVSGIFKADAGIILENADNFLQEHGYIFPLDLGAKGSCHVGGTIATNAGGLRLLRYGSLHGTVLGLEVVLPDGTIMDSTHSLRKDNTGYDLKQLFIGSEGTLGIITGFSILCPARPSFQNVAFLGVDSYEKVQEAFVLAKTSLSEILSAFEFMDHKSQELVKKCDNMESFPLEEQYPFYVLIETSGSNKEHDDEKLEKFLEDAMENEIVSDGIVAQDQAQLTSLWNWREHIPEASQHEGGVYKYDVSLPLPKLYGLIPAVREKLEAANLVGDSEEYPVIAPVGYGHIGDGNLHLNVAVRRYTKEVEKAIEPFVYEWIQANHGSISAEHGLGFQKKKYIGYTKSDTEVAMIKGLKQFYDPNGIMNPYKYV